MFSHRLRALAASAFACLLATASLAHAAPRGDTRPSRGWTVTELPTLTEFGGQARGINNRGDIVGTTAVAEHYSHPVIWRNGAVTDILAGNPAYGVANAVNDSGVVAATERSGVITWKSGATTSLGIAGEPLDINKSGAVVGFYYPCGEIAACASRGFYWKDGVLRELPPLSRNGSIALGVNDRGLVVGWSIPDFSSDLHAVVWEDGVLRELQALGGVNSQAVDVNNRGVVLGSAETADGINHLVTWDAPRGIITHDYGPRLSAAGINDRGAIVGNNLDTGAPFLLEDGAFTWLLDLPEMRAAGITAFAPMDINEHGWIVGVAYRAGAGSEGLPLLLVPPKGKG